MALRTLGLQLTSSHERREFLLRGLELHQKDLQAEIGRTRHIGGLYFLTLSLRMGR